MKRNLFLKSTAATAGLVAISPITALANNNKPSKLFEGMYRTEYQDPNSSYKEYLKYDVYFNDEKLDLLSIVNDKSNIYFLISDGENGHKFLETAIDNHVNVSLDMDFIKNKKLKNIKCYLSKFIDHTNKTYHPYWFSNQYPSMKLPLKGISNDGVIFAEYVDIFTPIPKGYIPD